VQRANIDYTSCVSSSTLISRCQEMSWRSSTAVAVCCLICVSSSFAWMGSGSAARHGHSNHAHSAPHCHGMGVPGAGGRRETALHAKEEYSNKATEFLGSFLQEKPSALDDINWDVAKRRKSSLSKLAVDLEQALGRREWFVTGNVDAAFFSEEFVFEDPDVRLAGVRVYARGVNKLFDQATSRCEVRE
jgi:hypothetical protein